MPLDLYRWTTHKVGSHTHECNHTCKLQQKCHPSASGIYKIQRSPHTKGHPSHQARFQIPRDSKIKKTVPLKISHSCFKSLFHSRRDGLIRGEVTAELTYLFITSSGQSETCITQSYHGSKELSFLSHHIKLYKKTYTFTRLYQNSLVNIRFKIICNNHSLEKHCGKFNNFVLIDSLRNCDYPWVLDWRPLITSC